ncbi:MAG: hypothetical protein Q7T56_17000 [Nocardioidaceae bacterium]|nr:hypothetical protein [Nocardioidaceae bacterium]
MRSRWAAALRIARRDALRHRGRSLLVMLMVGLPVMLAAGVATAVSTADVDAREALPLTVGASQAYVTTDGYVGPVSQSPDGRQTVNDSDADGEPTRSAGESAADLARRLDADVVPVRVGDSEAAGAARDGGAAYVQVLATDLTDPLTRGLVDLDRGRLPRSDDEVVVSPGIAHTGHEPGRTLTVGDRRLTVVGVGTTGPRYVPGAGVVVTDAAFDDVVASAVPNAAREQGFLVGRSAPVTWSDVQALNQVGYGVTSRAVVLDPPSGVEDPYGDSSSGTDTTVAGLVVACIVIEVALLAGPAFAVGARRQRRQLALVAAGGGSPSDLRRVILSGALVVGGVAAAVGAVVGVALAPLALGVAARYADVVRGPFDLPWGRKVLAALLGLLAAVVAEWVPARQAARRDLVTALTERPDDPRPAPGWPVLGGVLVAVGLALVLSGRSIGYDRGLVVAIGTVVLVVGAVFLVPLVIGGVGRLAGRLPLALRLAVRDTSRQRARSAPAVAAVMAVVAGITALAVASASDFAQDERDYVYSLPQGQVQIGVGWDGAEVVGDRDPASQADALVADAARVLPAHRLVPVRTASTYDGQVETSWEVALGACTGACTFVYGDGYAVDPSGRGVLVADADDLAAMGVRLDPTARDALAAGRVLVGEGDLRGQDEVTLVGSTYDIGGGSTSRPRYETVPAAAADLTVTTDVPAGHRGSVAAVVVPPATAARAGIVATPQAVVSDVRDGPLSAADVTTLGALQRDGDPVSDSLTVERGFTETFTWQFLGLSVAGGLLVLLGTLTATGLALADARPDLATLSAVGAAPRTRRAVAAAQALVVGVVGAVLGVVVGVVPGWVAATSLTGGEFGSRGPIHVVPWVLLAVVVLLVPVLAALVSGLAVRSRAVLVRRTA